MQLRGARTGGLGLDWLWLASCFGFLEILKISMVAFLVDLLQLPVRVPYAVDVVNVSFLRLGC